MKPIAVIQASLFLFGASLASAADPIFHEPLDSLTAVVADTQLMNPTAVGPGKIGQAVLLESRTENLLADPRFKNPALGAWILLDGASEADGFAMIPAGGMLRQVIKEIKPDNLYCFSVYAEATKGPGRVSLAWDGAAEENTQTFQLDGKGRQRIWVSGKGVSGSATVTVTAVEGNIKVEQAQFERGGTVPTSFVEGKTRSTSGLVWSPGDGQFKQMEGTVAFWIKADWAGERMSSAKNLFQISREPDEDWKNMRNVIVLNAWLTNPEALDWKYALNLRITDKDLQSHTLRVPLQGLTKDWHHIAVTWNLNDPSRGRATIYLDGEARTGADNLQSAGLEDALAVAFGQASGGYLDGWLDDARIYQNELSSEEIRKLAKGNP